MDILDQALDLLYPRTCPICGGASDRARRFICWNCAAALDICSSETPLCAVCGMVPSGEAGGAFVCEACRRRRPAYDLARSALPYAGPVRRLVHDFKYNRHIWYQRDFADAMEACARSCLDTREIDFVLPVPLFPTKFVLRSYNQSALLAGELAARLGVACGGRCLRRVRDTPTQTHLGAAGRHANVREAFRVVAPELVAGRTILVVDDIMTTGATLDEIAGVLKKARAWRVWCLTLGRAPTGR